MKKKKTAKKTQSAQSKKRGKTSKKPKKSGGMLVSVKESSSKLAKKEEPDSEVVSVPSKVFQTCPVHNKERFKIGGFCTACYGDETAQRIMKLDKDLDDIVLSSLSDQIDAILNSDDLVLKERFISRILKRFKRPDVQRVDVVKRNVNLDGPVDFGRGK